MQKLIALFLCGILSRHLYAMPCYVAEVEHAENMVCFTDYATGHDWWQDGVGMFEQYDGANLVMFDMMTPENRYDDMILRATYNRTDEYRKMKGELK